MRRLGTIAMTALLVAAFATIGYLLASRGKRGPASPLLSWDDLVPSDWLYALATRTSPIDGHDVHYPTPTEELAKALAGRKETAALRHLAEARWELGDRAGAIATYRRWADAEGAEAWAELASWAHDHREMPLAFEAVQKALSVLDGLEPARRRALMDQQIAWADHEGTPDPMRLRQARARMFAGDPGAALDWIHALEGAGRLPEAEAALDGTTALDPEKRLTMRAELLEKQGKHARAFQLLDAVMDKPWSAELRASFASAVDRGAPEMPGTWRASLEKGFDAKALSRLASYFEGGGRDADARDLLAQVARRHDASFDRAAWLLVARILEESSDRPGAFRARLSAASLGRGAEEDDDLAKLASLALDADATALAYGSYNDEPLRWAARIDRTPGFFTGGLSFLLTGEDLSYALSQLEDKAVAERTFQTGRLLTDELVKRAPAHKEIPALRVKIMRKLVDRGDGKAALVLFGKVEGAKPRPSPEVLDAAHEVALLAMRQVEVPISEEQGLWTARLRSLAADGTVPIASVEPDVDTGDEGYSEDGESEEAAPNPDRPRPYRAVLSDAIGRLDERDPTHRAALALVLGEMERLPDAEDIWIELAAQLEQWNLDDDMGPRYEAALKRFAEPGWWDRLARWYARHTRHAELEKLARSLSETFRGSALFDRIERVDVNLEIPDRPGAGARVSLVTYADLVRLMALERFPHSRQVFHEAVTHLLRRSELERDRAAYEKRSPQPVVVDDKLLDDRRYALLFVDPGILDELLSADVTSGNLERRVDALLARSGRTPVEDRILFRALCRLSRFEEAAPAIDAIAALYPGDAEIASQALSLHRSLAAHDPGQSRLAAQVVDRTAPSQLDPSPLFTSLGELAEDSGRPAEAKAAWDRILASDPRDPAKILELSTLYWDYYHMADALAVIVAGRAATGQPHLHAFEAGVLDEEVHDLRGALQEYLASLEENASSSDGGYGLWSLADQRAARRLAQLLGRKRPLETIVAKIDELHPGSRSDEDWYKSLLYLVQVEPEDLEEGEWDDREAMPNDPDGREKRSEERTLALPTQESGLATVRSRLYAKALQMVPAATETKLLDAIDGWMSQLTDDPDQIVDLKDAVFARRSALATTPERRLEQDLARIDYLMAAWRKDRALALWSEVLGRVEALPEGATRMHALAHHAEHLATLQGEDAALEAWRALGKRYAWSRGVLEDEIAFLDVHGHGDEGRAILEGAVARAAAGHREELLERLTRDALGAKDYAQARRAVSQLLDTNSLGNLDRINAATLLARVSILSDPAFDPMTLAKDECKKLPADYHAWLFRDLARAAHQERAYGKAVPLFIESLNREADRSLVGEAYRSAERAGNVAGLMSFFQKQQAASPRDFRWAAICSELSLWNHDLESALAMARTAANVRPDHEDLHQQVSDILVRAGRIKEAADSWSVWQKPRPGSEDTASARSALYLRGGDPARALDAERVALAAYENESPMDDEREGELVARTGRAVSRLLERGAPDLAWKLATMDDDGKEDVSLLSECDLDADAQARLAQLAGRGLEVLEARMTDREYFLASASALASYGTTEQRETTLRWLSERIGGGGDAALDTFWPYVQSAGLDEPMKIALAASLVHASAGPWSDDPPADFLERVAPNLVKQVSLPEPGGGTRTHWKMEAPALETLQGLWVRDLVRRDRVAELGRYLDPFWSDLAARARARDALAPAGQSVEALAWTRWLSDPAVFDAWVRSLSERSDRLAEVAQIASDQDSWERMWVLGARSWSLAPLMSVLPESARTAWFRMSLDPSPMDPDPVRARRGQVVERVSLALSHLVEGAPKAGDDPTIVKLRGPRTVGSVLAADPAFRFTELAPRKDQSGAIRESGDERVYGQGIEEGRAPGLLWGDRPGEAWYVLETIARLEANDGSAALVPGEVPDRGGEGGRAEVAIRIAEALGGIDLALALDRKHPGPAHDADRLALRVRLLVKAHRVPEAEALVAAHVKAGQALFKEDDFVLLRHLAADNGLQDPLASFDETVDIRPDLLAFLYEDVGPSVTARLHTGDEQAFRSALAMRWQSREESLDAAQLSVWAEALWPTGAADLPGETALAKLGGLWRVARPWLEGLDQSARAGAVAAMKAYPDTSALEDLVARGPAPNGDAARLLVLRCFLARRADDDAVNVIVDLIHDLSGKPSVAYDSGDSAEDEEAQEDAQGESARETEDDASVARLRMYRQPFKERADLLGRVDGLCSAYLEERRRNEKTPVSAWAFALEIRGGERASLLAELENAFIRGDFDDEELGRIAEILPRRAPEAGPRFLERWPVSYDHETVVRRARVMTALKDDAGAIRFLESARGHRSWTLADDVKTFDLWRQALARGNGAPADKAPLAWKRAYVFWRGSADDVARDLPEHLREHPLDLLAARAMLRTVAPLPEEASRLAARTLRYGAGKGIGDQGDQEMLGLRASRALLHESWRAALHCVSSVGAEWLAGELSRRHMKAPDIDAALADAARIYHEASQQGSVDMVISILERRKSPIAADVRAELLRPVEKPVPPFRLENGRPVPYRPRDLDWSVVRKMVSRRS